MCAYVSVYFVCMFVSLCMTDRRTAHMQLGVASRIEVMLGCRFVTSEWKNASAVIVAVLIVVVVMRAW